MINHYWRVIFSLILLITSFQHAYSQPFVDLINLRYQYFPNVSYTGSNKKMTLNEYTASLSLPIQLKNKDVVIGGAYFDQVAIGFSDTSINKNLYGVSLQMGYIHHWKGTKWKTLLMTLPKISANHIDVSSHTVQLGGLALFTFQKRQNLAYKFGLYYNAEFFGHFFVPLVGLDWKPNPQLNLYGLIPSVFTVEYKLNTQFYTGLSYLNLTQSYRIDASNDFVRNGDRFWGNIQLKIFGNYYLKNHFVIFSEVGYTFFRGYEAYQNATDLLNHPLFSKTNDGALVNIGLAYRIRLDQ